MPVIQLPDYTKSSEEYYCACATLLGYMFFPDDEVSRLKYTVSLTANLGKELVGNAIQREENVDAIKQLATRLISFSNIEEPNTFDGYLETRYTRGLMAGDVLTYCIQLFHDERIKEPSLTKAKAIVRHKYAHCKTISGELISRSEIGDVWSNYKDVAHFWYAWRELQGDYEASILATPCPVIQHFRIFIGIAEAGREIGQLLRAKRQPTKQSTAGCILDKETIHTLPLNYAIPRVTSSGIPPLDDWSMEILKASHKRC